MRVAGDENLRRTRARLERSPAARAALRRLGIGEVAERRLMLGLKEPYESRDGVVVEDALAFPILGSDGMPRGRYGFAALPGLTRNAPLNATSWGVGRPLSYWSNLTSPALPLVVCPDHLTMWLASQLLDERPAPAFNLLTWSHGEEVPLEWNDDRFWTAWTSVTVLGGDERMGRVASLVARAHPGGVKVATPPGEGGTWASILAAGMSEADLARRIGDANPWMPPELQEDEAESLVGEFPARAVHVATAFVGGNLFYPYLVEERMVEVRTGAARRVVHRYGVRVVRSDGAVLKVVELPASRGTGRSERVLALSDGMRIAAAPCVSRHASWSFGSIERYIGSGEARSRLHRPLDLILSDVETYISDCVWLPHADDALVAAIYVLLSHLFQVFDAVPLLLLLGPKASGKSELGQAIADLACNGVVVGQTSGAGLIRLMHEARGLVVLDDLERIGAAVGGGFGELSQVLKQSYKRSSATKQVADSSGRIETIEFYGPKVVSNTRGADPVLASRMITIATAPFPDDAGDSSRAGGDADRAARLRDELHCWGMASAAIVHEAAAARALPTSRRAEIEEPLHVLAMLCGPQVTSRLTGALERARGVAPMDFAERLRRAVAGALGGLAATEVSIAQLQLELALAGGERAAPSPETIGRTLASIGLRQAGAEGRRERLNGVVCRVVALDAAGLARLGMAPTTETIDPLAFCRGRACSGCRYVQVCGDASPGLRAARRARGEDRASS